MAQHNVQDLHIGALHALAAHAADAFDGLFDVILDKTLAGLKDSALLAHVHGEQSHADRRGDLGGAGALRPVADHAAGGIDGVGDDAADVLIAAAEHIGDAAGEREIHKVGRAEELDAQNNGRDGAIDRAAEHADKPERRGNNVYKCKNKLNLYNAVNRHYQTQQRYACRYAY